MPHRPFPCRPRPPPAFKRRTAPCSTPTSILVRTFEALPPLSPGLPASEKAKPGAKTAVASSQLLDDWFAWQVGRAVSASSPGGIASRGCSRREQTQQLWRRRQCCAAAGAYALHQPSGTVVHVKMCSGWRRGTILLPCLPRPECRAGYSAAYDLLAAARKQLTAVYCPACMLQSCNQDLVLFRFRCIPTTQMGSLLGKGLDEPCAGHVLCACCAAPAGHSSKSRAQCIRLQNRCPKALQWTLCATASRHGADTLGTLLGRAPRRLAAGDQPPSASSST